MPRATCRCGHTISVPAEGPDRVVCPKCSARIRVRRGGGGDDGYVRFACECGRRLKVKAGEEATAGKCPDCGRVVPVPGSSSSAALPTGHPEAPTEELSAADVAMLDQWSLARLNAQALAVGSSPSPSRGKAEAGMRICPRCRRPVPLGAIACRECGAHVPKG